VGYPLQLIFKIHHSIVFHCDQAPFPSQSPDDVGARDRQSEQRKSGGNSGGMAPTVILPKEYNPVAALQSVEQLHSFLIKTFHCNPTSPHQWNQQRESPTSVSYKQVVAGRRIREMQVLDIFS